MNKWQLPFKGKTMIGTNRTALHSRARIMGAVLTLGATLAMPSRADSFFFSTGNQSRKARNLAVNSRCSIATEIDFEKRPKKGQIKDSVILEGAAVLLSDSRTRKKFSKIYEEKYAWDMKDFEEPIYRVSPKVVFGLTSEFDQTATRWTFDE